MFRKTRISSVVPGMCLGLVLWSFACSSRPSSTPAESQAPAEPEPRDTRPVIVALGDSLTAGLGVDPSSSYPAQLQGKIDSEGYGYQVVNAGVSGDTSAQGLNRLDVVRELKPRIVVLALGANDGLRGIPVESTRRNLDEIIRTLEADGTLVVLAGMQMPPNYGPEYTTAFRAIFPSLAREHRIPLIPFLLEGVGGRPSLNQSDGVHPTAEGYVLVTENVWKVLRPVLDRRS